MLFDRIFVLILALQGGRETQQERMQRLMKAQISKQVAKDTVTVRAKQAAEERDAAARRQIERAAMGIPRPRSPSPARWPAIAKRVCGRIGLVASVASNPAKGRSGGVSSRCGCWLLAELVTDRARAASESMDKLAFSCTFLERAGCHTARMRSVECLHKVPHLVVWVAY